MRDPARIDLILRRIHKIWHANPDMRLLQLLICASSLKGTDLNRDLFVLEDDVIFQGLNSILEITQKDEAKQRG